MPLDGLEANVAMLAGGKMLRTRLAARLIAEQTAVNDAVALEKAHQMRTTSTTRTTTARVTPAVQPGQLIMYNGWEPYQFKEWQDLSNIEPGMVKWLHFAGGYGHLRYRPLHWQPVPIDRAVRVDVEPVEE